MIDETGGHSEASRFGPLPTKTVSEPRRETPVFDTLQAAERWLDELRRQEGAGSFYEQD